MRKEMPPEPSYRVTWEMYDRARERSFIGSVNEFTATTIAQAAKWIRDQLPLRHSPDVEIDAVILEQIGSYHDAEGCACDTRLIGTYEPAAGEWDWEEEI